MDTLKKEHSDAGPWRALEQLVGQRAARGELYELARSELAEGDRKRAAVMLAQVAVQDPSYMARIVGLLPIMLFLSTLLFESAGPAETKVVLIMVSVVAVLSPSVFWRPYHKLTGPSDHRSTWPLFFLAVGAWIALLYYTLLVPLPDPGIN